MTDSRRPDDVRLSTADLAAAGERATDRDGDANGQRRPTAPSPSRAPGDRDVKERPQALTADGVTRAPKPAFEPLGPLFPANESERFRNRWQDIQAAFVDEPRQAVENADALVATAIKRLAEMFARERATLEQQWSRGNDVSTEDLRVALRRYRGFFDRLLSV